ncbi:hypothetical protein DM860_016331 [Cuscuta australis]|uniref:Cytochrome P450 n=1 Tax=Cuscuta australis TaxID=267555 RepID=A0A328E6M2_9ASTE|nr:hypothetical protein DM860_016331 [Cuscuta australis]
MDMIVLGTTTWVWSAVTLAWVVVAVAAIIAHHLFVREDYTTKKKGLVPPGPRGLPIIGHLHLLGKNPHQDFQRLSQTHGPIMHLRLGSVDTVVASSPQAAELFLRTHDLNFATRPPMRIADFLTYDKKGAVLGQYGPVWREMRKLYVIELLTNHKMGSFESLRREELCLLVESLKQAAAACREEGEAAAADLSAKVACMNMNISCRMLFGKKYEDKDIGDEKGFKVVIDQAIHLISATNLGDYFPLLSKLDVQGLSRRAKVVMNLFDQFFERILVEHENKQSPTSTTTEDFVDIILAMVRNKRTSFPFTRDHIKSMMLRVERPREVRARKI